MANQAELKIAPACRTLGISKSGYYDWLGRTPSQSSMSDAVMTERIHAIHKMSKESYGVPRVTAQLRDEGETINPKRVARLMKAAKLQGISRRRGYCITTERDRKAKAAPDLVNRAFKADAPNQLWVADMTYIPTWAGFIYLAVVVDVYRRKVVGWSMSLRMTADLVLTALNNAIAQRRPSGVIHHSDQGSQYTSTVFGKRCQEMNIKPSMGAVGDAYDNAMAESFFATLEHELLARTTFKTHMDARLEVFKWLEGWYNPRRRHSALGQVSPMAFEQAYWAKEANTAQKHELPTASAGTSQAPPAAVDNPAIALLEESSG